MGQKNTQRYWSRFAKAYEEKQVNVVGKEILYLMKEEILKEHQLGHVLELGCGTGLFTETLYKISGNIVATDFSDEMVKYARHKRGDLENVQFIQADALKLEFNDASFDTVFMANLIHVVGSAEQVIKECNRVLKKGGLLILTSFAVDEMHLFNRIAIGFRYLRTFGKPPKESLKEKITGKVIGNLLLNNGFEIKRNIVIGRRSRAIYLSSRKIND